MSMSEASSQALFNYFLLLGDDRLVLGHRLSEWVGHGPILEEDLALGNFSLDFLGQAQAFLTHAGEIEGKGRTADTLAYLRDSMSFKNCILLELPKGDFAYTITRQFFFDIYSVLLMQALQKCTYAPLSALAAKCLKEDLYHARHSEVWMLRLGDGTEESHRRVQEAVDSLWMYSGELFFEIEDTALLQKEFLIPSMTSLRSAWTSKVQEICKAATISLPAADTYMQKGGRDGRHSEHLGHMLAEMQVLPRSYPGAQW